MLRRSGRPLLGKGIVSHGGDVVGLVPLQISQVFAGVERWNPQAFWSRLYSRQRETHFLMIRLPLRPCPGGTPQYFLRPTHRAALLLLPWRARFQCNGRRANEDGAAKSPGSCCLVDCQGRLCSNSRGRGVRSLAADRAHMQDSRKALPRLAPAPQCSLGGLLYCASPGALKCQHHGFTLPHIGRLGARPSLLYRSPEVLSPP